MRLCKRGHEMTPENTCDVRPLNKRGTCRICRALLRRARVRTARNNAAHCAKGHDLTQHGALDRRGVTFCRMCRNVTAANAGRLLAMAAKGRQRDRRKVMRQPAPLIPPVYNAASRKALEEAKAEMARYDALNAGGYRWAA